VAIQINIHDVPEKVRGELAALIDSGAHGDWAQDVLMQLPVDLFPYEPFAGRTGELRRNVTSYDAWYIAIAEAPNLPLATLDEPLSKANGVACTFLTPGF
jgi:predicted nucleic acid-binding protein